MRNNFFWGIMCLFILPIALQAADFINLTPKPKTMSIGQGILMLPA